MKTYPVIAAIVAMTLYACQKAAPLTAGSTGSNSSTTRTTEADTTVTPFPQQKANAPGCPALPLYGDTVIYPQPVAGQDDIITPVNNPGAGTYYSWPAGMVIDVNTGAIDLTKSQTGLKYAIGFVPAGTKDTCLSTLIVGGASYYDSSYVIANGSVKAEPYYDAAPGLGNYCSGPGQGNGCKFDITGSAAAQNVIVNNSSGEIDLKNTLDGKGPAGGVFGSNPVDGQTVTTSIYYQLKKGSNNAMQRIDVELVYYASASSIPSSLSATLDTRLTNLLHGFLISTSTTPRPPLIIITRGK